MQKPYMRFVWILLSLLLIAAGSKIFEFGAIGAASEATDSKHGEVFKFRIRTRVETRKESGQFHAVTKPVQWEAKKTAVIVCDMWDLHHCLNATLRGGEMAPRMNQVLSAARTRGALIIHAPSSCMPAYKDHPARKRALAAPRTNDLPTDIGKWCYRIPAEEKGQYPIDQSDGGEDDQPEAHRKWAEKLKAMGRNPRAPWKTQTDQLTIHDSDVISDNGEEIWSVMEQRGIENVILVGVHTNMCVLGRPFGLRQMAKNNKNVVLMRDMTDTMYNPARQPFVSHFTGTDLIVEHIEKWVCPTITSDQIIGGDPFQFKHDQRPHLVIIMAEQEYETDRTLPEFALSHLGKDFKVSYVFANDRDRNDLPGLEVLDEADVAFISVRRRVLPNAQMTLIRRFVAAGKPVIGIRTASHAFSLRKDPVPPGYADWTEFDHDILGGNYTGHHGVGPHVQVTVSAGAKQHPLLAGVNISRLYSHGSLYRANPLAPSAKPLLIGTVPNQQPEPVAWVNHPQSSGRVFYTSMGHPDDFKLLVFNQLLRNAVYWAAGLAQPLPAAKTTDTSDYKTEWAAMSVPGTWNENSNGELKNYDGFAWYRCSVTIPRGWKGKELELLTERIDNAHEVYLNGAKLGGAGSFPPNYQSGLDQPKQYKIKPDQVKHGQDNLVAIRVFDHDGHGGFKGSAPILVSGDQAIAMNGRWEFRVGDDPAWASGPTRLTSTGIFWRIHNADEVKRRFAGADGGVLAPAAALAKMVVPDDCEVQLLLSEPTVRQPLFLDFDERGRLWVMQYLQYPYPAGLKMVSKDKYWRAVYDKIPAAPPNHVRGADKITIHEDTNGDGVFDKHKTFLEGLNIATSFARGRGGVWILNPPYLMFYPDQDQDDVPDSDPQVHLQGFGMEDTHSVANSLRWGPDGWLYACQGSTVSGNIVRPGLDKKVVHSMGQLIWRYHPATRRYEIFAEGGGNAFGCEIDAKGRVFSGLNGGDARGFYYAQGCYSRKGFSKHGPLSNPYAFGYFPAMTHHKVPRFTHNIIIYDGASLPERYHGKVFGVEPMQGQLVQSDFSADGSTFKTKDINRPVLSDDKRFRPVEIKVGPDGAIYFADLYEPQISHREHFSGQLDKTNGRIYRLQTKGAPAHGVFDLSKKSTRELLDVLRHPNKWYRQTALRLIGDRQDASIIPVLKRHIKENAGQFALECMWALYQSGGFNDQVAGETLNHEDPYVRLWTVRLLCDDRKVSPSIAAQLATLALHEPYVHVRSQLASSSKRIPAEHALPIIVNLLRHDEDIEDPHVPLLIWWAIESKCETESDSVLAVLRDSHLWGLPLMEKHVLTRLMRRFAQAGSRNDLLASARLLQLAPDEQKTQLLMEGFELAFQGRSLAGMPSELSQALLKAGGGSLTLRIRQDDSHAVDEALQQIANDNTELERRIEFVQVFGEVNQPDCVAVLLDVLVGSKDDELKMAILTALQPYRKSTIGQEVVRTYTGFSDDVVSVAQTLLASRPAWSRQFLEAIDVGQISPNTIPLDVVRKMTIHQDKRIAALIRKHFKNVEGASTAEMQKLIKHCSLALQSGSGDPYQGKQIYAKTCAKCHLLFGEGGRIGPDLTTYKRDDTLRILLNVVNPSAEIREGFETKLIITEDGRTVTGFIYDQDNRVVVLRGTDGQNIMIGRDRIEEIIPQRKSIMPEGQLKTMTDQQVRDLFAYLRSSQPLNN